jgi:hypothetical protein
MSETDPGDGLGRMPARKNVAATRPDPDKGQKEKARFREPDPSPVSIEDRQRVHAQCLGSLIRSTREGVIVRDHTFFL